MQDSKQQAYLDCIDGIHHAQSALDRLNGLYTDNYDELTWEQRRPDIIKSLIETGRNLVTAKMLLLECIMEEENVLNNAMREKYGQTASE